jgi:hypothetical protein
MYASFVIPTTGALATGGNGFWLPDSFALAKPVPVLVALLRLPDWFALFQEGAHAFFGVAAFAN